jgi:uncharacterized protein YndB with AHSA1/START domain
MKNKIEKTITINAPVARVWHALTDNKEFGQWFRVKLDGPFVPGRLTTGWMTYPGYEHVKFAVLVKTMVQNKHFSFSWHPNACDSNKDYSGEEQTLVEFELKECAAGTMIIVTESGFEKLPQDRRFEAFRGNEGGWTIQLRNIESHVTQSQCL